MPHDDETARFPTVPDAPAGAEPGTGAPRAQGSGAPTARTAEEQPTGPVRVSALNRPARVVSRSGHVVPVTPGADGTDDDVVDRTLLPGVVPPQRGAPAAEDARRVAGGATGGEPGPAAPPAPEGAPADPASVSPGPPPPTTAEERRDVPPPPVEEPLPPVRVGVVVSPRLTEVLGDGLLHLDTVLRDAVGGDAWDVSVVTDPVADHGTGALDILEASRDRLLDEDWDLAVVLTSVPLLEGRRAVVTQTAPVHGVGLVSVPGLGAVQVRARARRAVARLVGELVAVGTSADDTRPDAQRVRDRLRQLTADDDAAAPGGVRLAARVLGGHAGLLLAMVRANRPWRLLAPLSRALTAAGAAAVLTLVTTDLWLLADAFGVGRLLLLAVLSVLAVVVALVAGARLWERPRRARERRQVTLFNLATTGTVLVGVLVLHLALLVLALLGAALLVDAGVLAGVLGREPDAGTWWRLAWLTASLATVAGAVGAGLEDDDVVRAAAYTRSTESVDEPVDGSVDEPVDRQEDADRADDEGTTPPA